VEYMTVAEYKLLIAETAKKKNVISSGLRPRRGGTRLRAVTLHFGVAGTPRHRLLRSFQVGSELRADSAPLQYKV